MSEQLNGLDAISVREEAGLSTLKYLGVEGGQWVPDPVMLYGDEMYIRLIETRDGKIKDYNTKCFCYYLKNGGVIDYTSVINVLEGFFGRDHIAYTYSSEMSRWDRSRSSVMPDIAEWLRYIRDTDLLVTNSFHGVAFAIIFNTDFIYIPIHDWNGRKDVRITSLLETLGINPDSVCASSVDRFKELLATKGKFDWDRINEMLCNFRSTGREYLRRCIHGRES